MMAARVCLIVNPTAGGGKAGRLAPRVERALREHGLVVRRVDTRDLDHARGLGVQAAQAGEIVAALSGDGMVGVLADAIRTVPGAVLGVLPGGRGNDLARVLGIDRDAANACATIADGIPRRMDLGEVIDSGDDRPAQAFVGIASAGFDSECNRIANEAPRWLGGLAYAYSAVRALLSWRPARFEIELDPPGERHVYTGYSVVVANSKAYGGGMHVAPGALLDDGLLEVVAIERVSKLRFLANLPRVFKGTHVELDSVRVFRAAEVAISSDRPFTMYADGDPIGTLPVRLRAVSGALSVLVPPGATPDPAFAAPPPLPATAGEATGPSRPGSRRPTSDGGGPPVALPGESPAEV
jgi:YegS/Rv2252/BmrU family lipid kinase